MPSDYGTCGQWIRSSDLVDSFVDANSTQIITTWEDQSGSANNFSFGSTGAGVTTAGLFVPRSWRGFPGVRISRTRATSSYVPATGANVRSVVMVASHPNWPNEDTTFYQYGTNSTLQAFGLQIRGSSMTYNAVVPASVASSGNAQPSTPEVSILLYDGTNAKLWVNGSLILNSAQALNTGSTNGMFLGCAVANNQFSAFTLYEFAAFSSDLSSSVATITAVLRGEYQC